MLTCSYTISNYDDLVVYMYLSNTHIASRSLGTTAEMCDSGMLSSKRNTTLTELRLATTQSIAQPSHGYFGRGGK